ncbi:hypothetical protein F4859DRAFT_524779 [Xylaria cf. heliscus]|nr:hypothetical protein F4859DRAFT_524779 [Xylaria cf. heliscus]
MASGSQRVRELRAFFDEAKDTLWEQLFPVQDMQVLLQSVTRLQTQATVQLDLLTGLNRLHDRINQPNDPRIKNLVKFAFNSGSNTAASNTASDRRRERQLFLRRLDLPSLILCGSTYTVREIEYMEGRRFSFLIGNVASFVGLHMPSTDLYRESIARVVGTCIRAMADDPTACTDLIQSFDAYNSSAKVDGSNFPAQVEPKSEPEPQSRGILQGPDVGRNSTGHGISQISSAGQEAVEVPRNVLGSLYRYSEAAKDTLNNVLGHNLSTAIHNSRQWRLNEQEMSTTSCVSMIIPENAHQDVLISIWVSQENGFQIRKDLGMQFSRELS